MDSLTLYLDSLSDDMIERLKGWQPGDPPLADWLRVLELRCPTNGKTLYATSEPGLCPYCKEYVVGFLVAAKRDRPMEHLTVDSIQVILLGE